jgi:hypothetical protein
MRPSQIWSMCNLCKIQIEVFYLYCGNTNLVSCHAESPQLKEEADLSYFSQARERLETKNFVFCILAKSLAKFFFAFSRK